MIENIIKCALIAATLALAVHYHNTYVAPSAPECDIMPDCAGLQ